jgi:hypothetical protein
MMRLILILFELSLCTRSWALCTQQQAFAKAVPVLRQALELKPAEVTRQKLDAKPWRR